MANRNYNQFQGTLERGVVKLFLKAKFGASGAVESVDRAHGIKSLTRDSVGKYTVVFGSAGRPGVDKYHALLSVQATFENGATLPVAPIVSVKDGSDVANGKLEINTWSTAAPPVLANPATGEVVYLEITLANTDAY